MDPTDPLPATLLEIETWDHSMIVMWAETIGISHSGVEHLVQAVTLRGEEIADESCAEHLLSELLCADDAELAICELNALRTMRRVQSKMETPALKTPAYSAADGQSNCANDSCNVVAALQSVGLPSLAQTLLQQRIGKPPSVAAGDEGCADTLPTPPRRSTLGDLRLRQMLLMGGFDTFTGDDDDEGCSDWDNFVEETLPTLDGPCRGDTSDDEEGTSLCRGHFELPEAVLSAHDASVDGDGVVGTMWDDRASQTSSSSSWASSRSGTPFSSLEAQQALEAHRQLREERWAQQDDEFATDAGVTSSCATQENAAEIASHPALPIQDAVLITAKLAADIYMRKQRESRITANGSDGNQLLHDEIAALKAELLQQTAGMNQRK